MKILKVVFFCCWLAFVCYIAYSYIDMMSRATTTESIYFLGNQLKFWMFGDMIITVLIIDRFWFKKS